MIFREIEKNSNSQCVKNCSFVSKVNSTSLGALAKIILVEFNAKHYKEQLFDFYSVNIPSSIVSSRTKRQAEFLAGRISAKFCLEALGQEYLIEIPIGSDKAPVWPTNVKGSISHTANLAVTLAGVSSQNRSYGVDIEKIVDKDGANAVISIVLNGAELHLCKSSKLPILAVLTMVFSAKECFYKAAFPYVNSFFGFEAISAISITNDSILFRLEKSLCPLLLKDKIVEVNWIFISNDQVLTYMELEA